VEAAVTCVVVLGKGARRVPSDEGSGLPEGLPDSEVPHAGLDRALAGDPQVASCVALLAWQNIFLFAALYVEAEAWQVGPTFDSALINQFDGFYFSVITLFTIGYGDIAPVTPFARFLVTVQVLLGWVTLALLGNNLFKAASRTS
jgi:hypothetical protein